MGTLAKRLATIGGLGALPVAPGTIGSLVGLLIAWLAASHLSPLVNLIAAAAAFAVGIAVSGQAARQLHNPDPSAVIIDEVVGMWLVYAAMPRTLEAVVPTVLAFALFRVFDIVKPPPLRRLERFPGGWGIMLDDLGAALYAALVLWVLSPVVQQVTWWWIHR